jgi:hypothetical protein
VEVHRVVEQPVRVIVQAGEDRGLGSRADRVGDEGVAEDPAGLRQPVHVRRADSRRAEEAGLRALVLGQDEQDIRLRGGRGDGG